jgi:hypothetical protein
MALPMPRLDPVTKIFLFIKVLNFQLNPAGKR